jgi:hypothetical protein
MQQTVAKSQERTGQIVIAPRVKEFGTRRYLWLLLLLPPAVYGIQRAVREIATIEHTLAEEGAAAARVISYELPVGKNIAYPVEPGSEILRVVVHPFRLNTPLPTAPLVAKVKVNVAAGTRPIEESFSVPLSSVATRVRAEDAAVYVGDPSTFDVDLVGRNQGDVKITLETLDGADGMLVRAYVRQALDKSEAERRGQKLDPAHAKKLAQSVWEADLDELDAAEREAVVGVRWRKLGVSRSGDVPKTWPLALAPRAPARTPEAHGALVAMLPLAGNEKLAYAAQTNATVWVASDDPTKLPEIAIKTADGLTRAGAPETPLVMTPGEVIEVACPRGANISIRAPDPLSLQPYIHTPVYRISRTKPLRVHAPLAPLVLRLSARRPLARSALPNTARVAVMGHFAVAGRDDAMNGEALPSFYDRYDDKLQRDIPSEKVARYALVPRGDTLELSSADDVDIALSELDPDAPPFPSKGRPVDEPPPKLQLATDDWHGFVPRNPTNASAFVVDGRLGLRIARRFVEVPVQPSHQSAYVHLTPAGPPAGPKRMVAGRVFEKVGSEWDTTPIKSGTIMYVPLRLFTEQPARVVAEVDGGRPNRRDAGIVQSITLTHSIDIVPGESFATIVLGDDLAAGKHRVRLRVVSGAQQVWFHAPWIVGQKPSRWVAGDFED